MTLLNQIKTNRKLRKLFGNKELKIVEKQLLGVPLTDSEITRLSRDIRKKFEAIKDLSKFSNEFDLKKASEIRSLIEEAKEVILESKHFPKIKKIYLFGSFIENKLTLNSDIDIAIELTNTEKREATKIRSEFSGRVNKRVDIQVFNYLPEKIKKEIRNKGKILYQK